MTKDLMRIPRRPRTLSVLAAVVLALVAALRPPPAVHAQGVTTGNVAGIVTDSAGTPIANATVVAIHVPSGTQYRAVTRSGGAYNLPNVRVGGPYRVTASFLGFQPGTRENVFAALGETQRIDFRLGRAAVQLAGVQVSARRDETEGIRTGAATFIDPLQVAALPSVNRSTRDLIRIDPRNDGNYAFAGRNWLFNNISLDGSYFNNSFGLDDPAPGGQTKAEPVPFDAVEQVQVSVAPFDVRESGFTGANVNTVTKSGTNQFRGSAYSYLRNDAFIGSRVSGQRVVPNVDSKYNQSGVSFSGPIVRDKLFFFVNGEVVRSDAPGSNFIANRGTGTPGFGVSRVSAATMDAIRARLATYSYETGPYEGYLHETNNDKLLAKLDWNLNAANTFTFRYNYLDASHDLPPHAFVLSFANTGRGPNSASLPFRNSGYRMTNQINSIATELNSRGTRFANRLFVSYNRFRDFR
ncbi:MAG: carboxypeptidase-like regulatory domain-containing protein, partial [Gemmatimonadota bacterium]|nr:carboxypeptidase-like regulatory domain-containing protein [Gemmatimonadota bacterium]